MNRTFDSAQARPYDPSVVEPKWQKKWADAKAFEVDLRKAKNPYYSLVMFPYPSGDKLHVGHWYNFAPADSWARYMRMHGNTTFTPMGFDAFGLPAENYAVKTGVPPAESTTKNVQTMIKQLKHIGCMYDWDKMVNTSDPEYYRWTQWLFLQMYKHELAYKKEAPVNFCPSCQTVLANEQAQDGKCERCGTEVVQKFLTQWFWNTRKYAQQLLDGLETLDWPDKTKTMQRNWIGRSEGAEIHFTVSLDEKQPAWERRKDVMIKVFSTRPDTLFGATYLVLAPEHLLVDVITLPDHRGRVDAYRKEVEKKTELQRTDLEKTKSGVPTGAFAINPANEERIPIWIADYVLTSYGTGAIMAVPGHDERDYAFAKTHNLPITEVVSGGDLSEGPFTAEGKAVHSAFLNGLGTQEAKKRMIAWLEDNNAGRGIINYRLRDWLVSRQRYWGAPIPIIYDPEGKAHPIPEKHLPWLLPTDVEFKPTGESPLKHSKEFKARTEKIFGKGWEPEYDTMDTFVCSSFYYLRYLNSGQKSVVSDQIHNEKLTTHHSPLTTPVDPHVEHTWMPVSMYIGGPEHACMHLIYARFVMMALKDFGFVSHNEPFQKLVHQGIITNKGAKMSKSKNNVVSPDSFIDRHGSDVFRMYLMFMGPFTEGGDWSDTGIKGIDRFVQRLWKVLTETPLRPSGSAGQDKKIDQKNPQLEGLIHKTIQRVTDSMNRMHFNTAISAIMECLNELEKQESIPLDVALTITKLLSPIAPHLAEELWETLGGEGLVIDQHWPAFDPRKTKSETLTIAVQVNGKLRGTIDVAHDLPEKDVIALAKAQENVQKYLEGNTPKKELYIKGRLVSLVM